MLGCARGRGVQTYRFPLPWCWNTSREGTYCAVTGHGTCNRFWKPNVLFYILFLNNVGYLFVWQKQGCPARVHSKYFICQLLTALVTTSSINSYGKWICLLCHLNFPCAFFFPPRLMCSYPCSLSQSSGSFCKGTAFCGLSVWLNSLGG